MKNFLNLGFIVLLLVVLGCSCPNLQDLNLEEKPASTPANTSTTSPFGTNTNVSENKTADTNTNSTVNSSGTAELTMEKYNQIKNGMTYDEVVQILGSKGEEVSSSEIGKYKNATYKWSGENYSFIIGTFQNDKLLFKTQANLK